MAYLKKFSRQLFYIGIISFLNWTFHSAIAANFEKNCTNNGGHYYSYGVIDSKLKKDVKSKAFIKTFFGKIPLFKVKNAAVAWGYGGKYFPSSAEAIMYAIEEGHRNIGKRTREDFFKSCPEANQFTKEGIEITVEGCLKNEKYKGWNIQLKMDAPKQGNYRYIQLKKCNFKHFSE